MGAEDRYGFPLLRVDREREDKEEGGSPQPTPDSGTVVIPPPVTNTTPIQPNIFLPPGVDPYYGLTISSLTPGTGGGGTTPVTPPDEQDGTIGSKQEIFSPKQEIWGRSENRDEAYKAYLRKGGSLPYNDWKLLMNASASTGEAPAFNSGFNIATPNMTWQNSLPTVMPASGQAAASQYGPVPFTREANTPGVTYNPPPLTYFNPYNTNPYLPTSNPFALVPNNTAPAQ